MRELPVLRVRRKSSSLPLVLRLLPGSLRVKRDHRLRPSWFFRVATMISALSWKVHTQYGRFSIRIGVTSGRPSRKARKFPPRTNALSSSPLMSSTFRIARATVRFNLGVDPPFASSSSIVRVDGSTLIKLNGRPRSRKTHISARPFSTSRMYRRANRFPATQLSRAWPARRRFLTEQISRRS